MSEDFIDYRTLLNPEPSNIAVTDKEKKQKKKEEDQSIALLKTEIITRRLKI